MTQEPSFSLNKQPRASILNVDIDATSYGDMCDRIIELIKQGKTGFIVVANVHVVMTAHSDRHYRQALANATIVTPDGMPLVWGMRALGFRGQTRVYGPDLMLAWCARSAQANLPIYLFGATPATLEKLAQNLQSRYPSLTIAGKHAPPQIDFDSQDFATQLEQDVQIINAAGAAVVFVALGCPKQELWMDYAQPKLKAIAIGVGAAFDFHSGQVAQAPRWMMAIGLEWLYRLWQEPKRLWRRYLLNNPLFVVLFAGQLGQHWWRQLHKSMGKSKPQKLEP
ncbi:MAG: WecB/TagA/CpsF family glycosyltransferase [Pseudanabaenaceae cyanobacterium bins.39]|nr:WecB/TagA/CpsF family glycosyltransferase [Pseudanabaenaceae cyanobacterium bins.39]